LKKLFNTSKNGESIIELVGALSVILIVILALISGITAAVNSNNFSRTKSQATNYAQEGMENLRGYRDTDWTIFLAAADGEFHGLAGNLPSGVCSENSPIISGTNFVRCAKLEKVDDTKVKATIKVTWVDSKGTSKSELVSYFTKW